MIPRPTTTEPVESFDFLAWRNRFIRLILRGAIVFGVFVMVPTLFTDTDPAFFLLYGVVYLILLVVTFANFSYSVKAWTFIGLFYLLGVSGLLDTSIWGDARLFFIASAFAAALLLSTRSALWVAGFTLLTTTVAGWYYLTGRLVPGTAGIWGGNLAAWLSGAAVVVFMDAVFILAIDMLVKEFSKASDRAAQSFRALEKERRLLEKNVEIRTQESTRKSSQLEAASVVARRITDIRDLQLLLNDVARTIAEQFKLYHVGIFMLDETGKNAMLEAAFSEGGARMLEEGHRHKVGGDSLVGQATGKSRVQVLADSSSDPDFKQNPLLPLTRSELTIPLIVHEKVIGALDIHSEIHHAFQETDIGIMQSVAGQLATAIENVRLFNEAQTAVAQYESVNTLLTPKLWSRFLKGRRHAFQYRSTGLRPYDGTSAPDDEGTLRVPLMLRGREIGVIRLRRKADAPAWVDRERELASEVAAQVALALDTARLLEETTHRAEIERTTSDISARIGSTTLYESILKTTAEELSRVLGGPEVLVQIQPLQPEDSGNGQRKAAAL